jgi:hypothetical protein
VEAEAPIAAARDTASRWGDAAVAVRVVAKTRVVVEGEEYDQGESAQELGATIIDPSGLVVCSLSEVDPSQHIERMVAKEDYRYEREITDLRILLADGREIPAKVALRDLDLDLAFIRPSEELPEQVPAVDLEEDAKREILDEVVVMSRLGQVGNRRALTVLDRVTAVVEKPRTLYVLGVNAYMWSLGCPVFTPEGKVVGITVMRVMPTADAGEGLSRGKQLPVVLPAADIVEVAKQLQPSANGGPENGG